MGQARAGWPAVNGCRRLFPKASSVGAGPGCNREGKTLATGRPRRRLVVTSP
jgi:hypothetical protein